MPALRDTLPLQLGAQVAADGVAYRVWAPDQAGVEVFIDRGGATHRLALTPAGLGYWAGWDEGGAAGDLYRFRLGGGVLLPDGASRYQPEGVHGRSACVDAGAYAWENVAWQRPGWKGQTTYELHLGTFTREGTFRAAIAQLERVRDLGVDAIELLPVADFAGNRNWGYDGVALYAPARCYGQPDDLRALVDAAHGHGLAVILDVVYNHVGPQGNYLHLYCADYFRPDQETPWGRAFNLDGPRSGPVREFLLGNVTAWLDDYRIDGLRVDATHAIPDRSPRHLLAEIAALAQARGGFVISEDERNRSEVFRSREHGGYGFDAGWADDFHHEIRVALTGTQKTYFSAFTGTPAEIADTLAAGWTYRGQPFGPWQGRPRGSDGTFLPPAAFVVCLENHDQVGNRAFGERLEHLVEPAKFRAASLLLCLGPYAPLLFMGQEWAASTPFLFFTQHGGKLGASISAGRRREFGAAHDANDPRQVPDPEALATFEDSKLRWEEVGESPHAERRELYQAALRERRALAAVGAFDRQHWCVHAGETSVALHYRLAGGARLLWFSFSDRPLTETDLPEPLRPSAGARWRVVLDSEASRFGGSEAGEEIGNVPRARALWLAAEEREAGHAAG